MGNTAAPMPPMLPTQVGGTSFPARLAPLAGSQSVPLALPAGARVVAEVVRTQSDGQVLLRLGQTLLAATLPGQHAVGDQLALIVLSEPGAQPALLLAPQTAAAASQAELSSTAQLLARLQQQAAPPLRAVDPLWAQPDGVASPKLADALAASVRSSGLFYESHLAAWVQGDLPTQALLDEPQGRLSQLAAGVLAEAMPGASVAEAPSGSLAAAAAALAPGEAAGSAAAAGLPHAVTEAAGGSPAQAHAEAPASASTSTPSFTQPSTPPSTPPPTTTVSMPAPPAPPAAPAHVALGAYSSVQAQGGALPAASSAASLASLPAQLQTLVQQQLATLAQGAVVWAGQAWPGQELEWRIEPDDQGAAGGGEAPSRAWTSVLRLDLPHLGRVVATLQLGPQQELRVRVEHDGSAGEMLRSQGPGLRQAVLAAGLRLDEFVLRPLSGGHDA